MRLFKGRTDCRADTVHLQRYCSSRVLHVRINYFVFVVYYATILYKTSVLARAIVAPYTVESYVFWTESAYSNEM